MDPLFLDKKIHRRKLPKRDTGQDERKHLTGLEIKKLLAAVKGARHEARDRCLILLMFRHGLRVSEAAGLTLAAVNMEGRSLRIVVAGCAAGARHVILLEDAYSS